jgi:ABC-2 type transport system permease protein
MHILVLVIGVLTTEVDGVIWMYRDLTRMGQFPVNMYMEPLRTILFFLIPVGTMFTIPAQVLINKPGQVSMVITLLIGLSSLIVSYSLWLWSLKKYTSTGS